MLIFHSDNFQTVHPSTFTAKLCAGMYIHNYVHMCSQSLLMYILLNKITVTTYDENTDH